MLRHLLRQVLRVMLRSMLRLIPTVVLREMPTLMPTELRSQVRTSMPTVMLRLQPATGKAVFGQTLTPPFCGQAGGSMASGTAARKKSVARSKGRLWKCRRRDGQKTVGRIKRRR